MRNDFQFTFANIEAQYQSALDAGYKFITCAEFAERKNTLSDLTVVNRVDIDLSVKKADRLRDIYDRLGIKASFFVRLHEPEYNPFAFENYRILKAIRDSGHEIGYHSEIVDQAAIWDEDADDCLRRDIAVLNHMLEIKIRGVASHGLVYDRPYGFGPGSGVVLGDLSNRKPGNQTDDDGVKDTV